MHVLAKCIDKLLLTNCEYPDKRYFCELTSLLSQIEIKHLLRSHNSVLDNPLGKCQTPFISMRWTWNLISDISFWFNIMIS